MDGHAACAMASAPLHAANYSLADANWNCSLAVANYTLADVSLQHTASASLHVPWGLRKLQFTLKSLFSSSYNSQLPPTCPRLLDLEHLLPDSLTYSHVCTHSLHALLHLEHRLG